MRKHLLLVLVVFALVAASCGDDDAATTTQAPSTTTTTTSGDTPAATTTTSGDTPAATTTTEPVPADRFDRSAILRVSYNTGPESLDPLDQTSGPISLSLNIFYDRLVHALPDTQLTAGLATSWEWIDDMTLELKLREGVVFHDGTPFDAEAVKVNIERTKAYEVATLATNGLSSVDSVEVVDSTTVRLLTNRVALDLLTNLAEPGGMMVSPTALANGVAIDLNPVGTGMFKFVSFAPSDRIVGEAWDGYWDPDAVLVAGIEYVQISDADTRLNALRSGQIDMSFIEPRQLADAQADSDLEAFPASALSVFEMLTNITKPPFDNVEVRKALSQSIDRQLIVETLFFDLGQATLQMFPPDYYAYNPDYGLDYLPYDPAAARQRLVDAGFPDGVELDILILNRPQDIQLSEVVQQMAAEGGITLNLVIAEPSQYSEFFPPGVVHIFLGRWGGRNDPLQTLTSLMGPEGSLNPGGGSTDTMAALLGQISALPDGPERTALIQQANAEATEQMLEIPLVAVQIPWVTDGCVVNFQPYLNTRDEFRGVGVLADCS